MAYSELSSCVVSGVKVQKLKSTRTGLIVCIAQVEGPLVNGYFCLATEAHDHDGLPHTLEHLIFMGSEDYPYKGMLDILSNRCLAQGTNAWTDTDHTCYTVTTAGSEGFLNLLPIYLDHILYPTLTEAAYVTEVHHVSGKGEDVGVVYCEMQARENEANSLSIFQLLQSFYPGDTGYKSETGGLMLNLRESTSNSKVRDYHRSYYRHDNLCLIITGQVDPESLFKALKPVEDKICSKDPLPPMERPWQTPVPPLTQTVERKILFPTEETEDGIVRVAWRGPSALDRYAMTAAGTLMEYLTDTSVAPLQRDLVEVDEPFCSDVQQTIVENLEVLLGFTLVGVPVEQLETAPQRLFEVLGGVASGREKIDTERMTSIIKRQILDIYNRIEETPHYFFAFNIIGDFLFARQPGDFPSFLNPEPYYRQLLDEPASFWTDLVDKYFVKGPHVSICGHPSAELAETLTTEERERVAQRVSQLGEQGLKEKAQIVEDSCKQNEIPPPEDLVSALPVPGTDSISFHPLTVLGNYMPKEQLSERPGYGKIPVDKIPFMFQLDNIHSGFVQLVAVLDTAVLSQQEKLYLPLYLELLFESPVIKNGELLSYEEVVKQLVADTIMCETSLGSGGGRFKTGVCFQAVFVSIKVEMDKYEAGVCWLKDLLYNIQFTAERAGVIASKMLNDVPRLRRKGAHIARTLHSKLLYCSHANPNLVNMLTQSDFLNDLTTKLKKNGGSEVLGPLAAVRDKLVSPDNLRVIMGTDVNKLSNPVDPWLNFTTTSSSVVPADLKAISPSRKFVSPTSKGRAFVAGVSGVESNYLIQSVPCIDSYTHGDYPAILVFIEYLCALEGPMWRQIRGMGLSYHYSMGVSPEGGKMTFNLFKATQLVRAYEVAKEIIEGFLTGKTEFEQSQLEAAVSGVVYATIETEKTVASADQEAGLNYIRQLDQDFNKKLLGSVAKVTIGDLKRVAAQYFTLLFDKRQTTTAVCCGPAKVTEVKEGLEKCGLEVNILSGLNQLSSIDNDQI